MNNSMATSFRNVLVLAAVLVTPGCELIGDIFQAGLLIGAILVLLVVGVIAWLFGKFRGR